MVEFFEQGDLETRGCLQPRVQGLPRRNDRFGQNLPSRRGEPFGGRHHVRDLEGDAYVSTDLAADLDAVDEAPLGAIDEFQWRTSDLQGDDPGVAVAFNVELLGQAQPVPKERQRRSKSSASTTSLSCLTVKLLIAPTFRFAPGGSALSLVRPYPDDPLAAVR